MMLPREPPPSPREAGRIVAVTIGHFPLVNLLSANTADVYADAQVSEEYIYAKYLQLMLAAALHAIERAGLEPGVEHQVVEGIYGWINEQPGPTRIVLLEGLEDTTDAFALAEADDLNMKDKTPGEYSQLELEFFDRLVALGSQEELRQQACLRLSTVLPKELWVVNQTSAVATLRRAELLRAQ
jgi:hypothetical protein